MNVKSILLAIPACWCLLTPASGQQTKPAPPPPAKPVHIEVSESVLKTADWAGFKYREVLAAAQTGDVSAVEKFLEFSRTVDGVDALNHAVTCLELIPAATDLAFSMAIVRLKPALKKVLLERLTLAQGRTKKVELREALQQWAPSTWSVLTGGDPICNCPRHGEGAEPQLAPPPPSRNDAPAGDQ